MYSIGPSTCHGNPVIHIFILFVLFCRVSSLQLTANAPENGSPLEKEVLIFKPPFLGGKNAVSFQGTGYIFGYYPRSPNSRPI